MLINSIWPCRVFILFPLSRLPDAYNHGLTLGPGYALKKKAKKKKWTEPSGSLGMGTGKNVHPPPPPPPLPPQSSPPLRSPTFLAVPPTLVPRVFWLVSQRGDAGTPLGHRQWWEHSSPTNGVDAMWGFSLLLFLSLTPTGFSPDSPVFSSS